MSLDETETVSARASMTGISRREIIKRVSKAAETDEGRSQLAAARGQAKVIAASVPGNSVQIEPCTEIPVTKPGPRGNDTRKAVEAETGLSKWSVNRKLAQARSEAAIDLGAPMTVAEQINAVDQIEQAASLPYEGSGGGQGGAEIQGCRLQGAILGAVGVPALGVCGSFRVYFAPEGLELS